MVFKDKFKDDPEVVLTTEDYFKKVTVGMTVWEIGEVMGKDFPNYIGSFKVISDPYKHEYGHKFTSTQKSNIHSGEYQRIQFVEDCFWSNKCLCLSEEKAEEVVQYLHNMYAKSKEWRDKVQWEKLSLELENRMFRDFYSGE